jgi:asparagine synthase (glutamine-hydrolysing)
MCGIAGCVVAAGAAPDDSRLQRMSAALIHRGPDGQHVRTIGSVGLVAARLAIVGVGPAGDQPLSDAAGTTWLAYNGEIFNHADLRRSLPDRGWHGGSDTETLVEVLADRGERALPQLNGLFAFAALDLRANRLLLVRDRFGVKPLYLAREGDSWWFASEIGALLAAGLPRRVNRDALAHQLARGWLNGSATLIDGVSRVLPGTLVEIDVTTGAAAQRTWYQPGEEVSAANAAELAGLPREALIDRLDERLGRAVQRRLMADQPVATMCSGGIDSSLVTHFAAREQPRTAAFNVAITDQPSADESRYAARVAQALGIELHTTAMDGATWRAGLIKAVRHCEYPLTHENSVPMADMARDARAAGFKVLLSGEAADELFGGYPWFDQWRTPPTARARMRALLAGGRRGAVPGVGGAGDRAPGPLDDPPPGPYPPADAFEHDARAAAAAVYRDHPPATAALEARLLSDLSVYLPHILNRQDKNTMQSSIETRVPFLDVDVVAYALNLPLAARATPARKGVLRELALRHLPREIVERPKIGFGFDAAAYLTSAADPDFLADGSLRETLAIDRRQWRQSLSTLAGRWAVYLWTGEIWCRAFLEGHSDASIDAALWRE